MRPDFVDQAHPVRPYGDVWVEDQLQRILEDQLHRLDDSRFQQADSAPFRGPATVLIVLIAIAAIIYFVGRLLVEHVCGG